MIPILLDDQVIFHWYDLYHIPVPSDHIIVQDKIYRVQERKYKGEKLEIIVIFHSSVYIK